MNLYGLIGYPLTHSFSKKYFTEKFEKEGIENSRYELFEIKSASELKDVIKNNQDLKGLNVTIPHKEAVIPFLDELDEPVKKIMAVNVIKLENGKLKGYNSDFHGFRKSLVNFIYKETVFENTSGDPAKDVTLKVLGMKALVLGTGGAAKAVMAALDSLNMEYKTVSRSKGNADLTYEGLKGNAGKYSLIINTTPLGMYPKIDTCPEIPYEELSSSHYLFDLVYNPEETLFMKKGKEAGAKTKNGLEMLYLQAEKAWEIWNQ